MNSDPHALFDAWLVEARAVEPNDPEAMALATAGADGRPSVRMVLLKGHDPHGFVFYTNSESRKGGELAANQKAADLAARRQVAAPSDPRRGRNRAGEPRRGGRLFRDPRPGFPARRLGVGAVPHAGEPRDFRGAFRGVRRRV